MSLQPRRLPEVPADTARAARAAFPRGSLAVRIRDELGEVWSDQRLQGLFGGARQTGDLPGPAEIVLVLAMAENLTDRRAADMVRRAIDWKYALGLAFGGSGVRLLGALVTHLDPAIGFPRPSVNSPSPSDHSHHCGYICLHSTNSTLPS